MRTSDFYYELPQELIAQDPLEDRSSSDLCIFLWQMAVLSIAISGIYWTI